MTAAEWWGLILGVPPVMLVLAGITAWILREKVALVVFWALRTYPETWRRVAEESKAFGDLFDGDPLARLQQALSGQEREIKDLREIIREDLAPLAALGPKLVALDYSVQTLSAEAKRLATAVEKIPDLAVAIEVLKTKVDTPTPPPRRRDR